MTAMTRCPTPRTSAPPTRNASSVNVYRQVITHHHNVPKLWTGVLLSIEHEHMVAFYGVGSLFAENENPQFSLPFSGCDCDPDSPNPDSFCPFDQFCKQCKCIQQGATHLIFISRFIFDLMTMNISQVVTVTRVFQMLMISAPEIR